MKIDPLAAQLEAILLDFQKMTSRSAQKDLSDLPKHERQALITRSVAAIQRVSGSKSPYALDLQRLLDKLPHLHLHMTSVMGVVQALYEDVKAGYLQSLVELVHAETFADFLEMSQHLADSGYKDAAAVISGSALEAHLRTLCVKNLVATEVIKTDGAVSPKKAETMNSELAAVVAYSKTDQKSVTAWLDIRNKAAHGRYAEYQAEQVALLIAGIRDFIARTSA